MTDFLIEAGKELYNYDATRIINYYVFDYAIYEYVLQINRKRKYLCFFDKHFSRVDS